MLLPLKDIVEQQIVDVSLKEKIELYLKDSNTEKFEANDITKLENIARYQIDEWFALRLKSLADMIKLSIELKISKN